MNRRIHFALDVVLRKLFNSANFICINDFIKFPVLGIRKHGYIEKSVPTVIETNDREGGARRGDAERRDCIIYELNIYGRDETEADIFDLPTR